MVDSRIPLKRKFLDLLREDEEFRFAVAGYLGLDETLRSLRLVQEELAKLREDMTAGFRRHDEELAKLWSELAKLREDMTAGFRRHDEELAKLWSELAKLREDMTAGFRRHDEELAKLWSELAKLREDMTAGFRRHDEELAKLREDMMRGFELVERHIAALGARWGILSEEAFRQGLKGLLERSFNVKVESWKGYDSEGYVFRRPSEVELDVAITDEQVILVEISSHVRRSDIYNFKSKADFYTMKTGRVPSRLLVVTPFADEDAVKAAEELGIEVYTKV
ncbi:MAG: DUF3782 domain-containing protein [Candidatus Korarchaeum sp.]